MTCCVIIHPILVTSASLSCYFFITCDCLIAVLCLGELCKLFILRCGLKHFVPLQLISEEEEGGVRVCLRCKVYRKNKSPIT